MKGSPARTFLLVVTLAIAACFAGGATAWAQSNPIQIENAKEGSTDWLLTRVARHDDEIYELGWHRRRGIEAYASQTSIRAGETLDVHVSTYPVNKYAVRIYRMGYYGGAGRASCGRSVRCRAPRSPRRRTATVLSWSATASGGRADVLADAPGPRGGAWSPSNVIVFAPDFEGPLFRISGSGGTPEPVTTLDAARKEHGHRFPTFLPDGEHFLYASLPGKAGKFDIFAGSLKDDSRTFIGSLESAPVYAAPGWLLYARQGVLAALPFDARVMKVTGDPVLLEDEPTSILDPATSFTAGKTASVSQTGSLAYYSSPSVNTAATWYGANGQSTGTLDLPPGHYESAAISPDGTRAVLVRSTSPSDSSLWMVNLAQGGASPFSSGRGRNDSPVWSPDGTRVVFASDRDGLQQIFVKNVDDAAPEQLLASSDVPFKNPASWSPDGQWIVITQLDARSAQNIWFMPASGGELKLFVRGPTRENGGPISPDGRWMAYASDETGRFEVYVQPFPEPGRRVQVSHQGAIGAWWTGDRRQLVLVSADLRVWRVDVDTTGTFRAGAPQLLATFPTGIVWMDAMPDRQRFLAIAPERTGIGSITVVQNWRSALPRSR